jgi:hypothetical protein
MFKYSAEARWIMFRSRMKELEVERDEKPRKQFQPEPGGRAAALFRSSHKNPLCASPGSSPKRKEG